MSSTSAPEIVSKLDQYIIGQADAKRAIAVALRSRLRRMNVDDELRKEIYPKNILMIGPTGCGKTEIARRLASLCGAPFVKVEATKYTEVGYHGKDVDDIINDLLENSISLIKKQKLSEYTEKAKKLAEDQIISTIHGPEVNFEDYRASLQAGEFDEREIEIEALFFPDNPPGISNEMHSIMNLLAQKASHGKMKKVKVSTARQIIEAFEQKKMMMNNTDILKEAIKNTEENGIVVIDEIDKLVDMDKSHSNPSAEGVQRDLLSLLDGSEIQTKHGNIKTDHILFIACGAFHCCKVSDLMAELQGRLPIRVQMKSLDENDLYRILTEPKFNLLTQQEALLKTEDISIEFNTEALLEIARVAFEVNHTVENIGARRLFTIMERVMDDVSFNAPDMESGTKVIITKELVQQKVSSMLRKTNFTKYII